MWPRGFVMIFTLTVTLFLFGWSDKILPPVQVAPASPFGDSGGFNVALTFVSNHQIGTFITCILVTLLMAWSVTKSRVGIYVRAIYDDGDSAATLGIPLSYFVVGVWAVAGALAGLAGILVSPRVTLDPYLILFVSIWALAGSILGGLESFGIAFGGSIAGRPLPAAHRRRRLRPPRPRAREPRRHPGGGGGGVLRRHQAAGPRPHPDVSPSATRLPIKA